MPLETSASVIHGGSEVILTWSQGETEVHVSINMVDLTVGWATHTKGEFTGTRMHYLPYELLNDLARIGVLPALQPHDC